MSDVDVLKDPGDYNEMAQLAWMAAPRVRRRRSCEKGFDRNVFNDQRTKDRDPAPAGGREEDRRVRPGAHSPSSSRRRTGPPTGDKNVAVGLRLPRLRAVRQGRRPAAARALSKGVSKNEPRDRLLLGIAQLKGGHKDDAIKTFKSVKGDPALERLAQAPVGRLH